MAAGLTRHRSECADAIMLEGLGGIWDGKAGKAFYRGIGANWDALLAGFVSSCEVSMGKSRGLTTHPRSWTGVVGLYLV